MLYSDMLCTSLVYLLCVVICLYYFFFFQAEDGIRDLYVTGVQTCALPICRSPSRQTATSTTRPRRRSSGSALQRRSRRSRSEERRVGKECRSRWAPYN